MRLRDGLSLLYFDLKLARLLRAGQAERRLLLLYLRGKFCIRKVEGSGVRDHKVVKFSGVNARNAVKQVRNS